MDGFIYTLKDNESEEQYIWRLGQAKDAGEVVATWDELADVINRLFRSDPSEYRTEAAYRKAYTQAKKFYEAGVFNQTKVDESKTSDASILDEIKKERIKLQTLNLERSRYDRAQARQELYYEQIGAACQALPVPEFIDFDMSGTSVSEDEEDEETMSYLCCLSDLHYGATFTSEHNDYSPEEFADRLELLMDHLMEFIIKHKLSHLHIANLGDTIQGILRMSDLKVNDSTVVRSVVEVSRYLAEFLNKLSQYVTIDYYHVPLSNHTQIRPLGSKASELADEDMEYIIGHYIQDLCRNNERIYMHLAEEGKQYLLAGIPGFEVYLMHGHQVKNVDDSLKSLQSLIGKDVDYLVLGHMHSGKVLSAFEGITYDGEVLVCPSFMGSDPYSDSIMKGSKAAVQIYGFSDIYGHTETYKYILN